MADAHPRRARFAIAPADLLTHPDLTDGAKQTWLWLDLKAGTSGLAKASYVEIAEARDCTTKSAQRHVRALIDAGFLTVRRVAAGHGKAHYGVVNRARSVDTNVQPDRIPMSTLGAVEATPMSALLESSKESEVESPPDAREHDGGCFCCGEPADGKPSRDGRACCWRHEDF